MNKEERMVHIDKMEKRVKRNRSTVNIMVLGVISVWAALMYLNDLRLTVLGIGAILVLIVLITGLNTAMRLDSLLIILLNEKGE